MRTKEITSILQLLEQGASSRRSLKELLPALETVAKVTPEVLPLAVRFMSTGSPLAQKAATSEVRSLLRGIIQNKDRTTKPWQSHEDIYRELIEYYLEMPLAADMTLKWHFNNVAAELGMSTYDVDRIIHYVVQNCAKSQPDEEQADVYWRGVSALHIASTHIVHVDPDQHEEFIEWAGSSDNVARIVTLAQERGTVVPEQLRAIMVEQKTIAPSLTSGTL